MQKTIRILLVIFAVLFGSNIIISAQYCFPTTTYVPSHNGYNFYIDRVQLGDIDNQDLTSPDVTAYDDYTQYGPWTNLTRGTTYSLTITGGPNATWFASMYYAAWIDFNNDGDFSDAGEKLGQYKTVAASQVFSINFTVPANASVSVTRMRVRCTYSSSAITVDPCTSYLYGEAEDYIVGITDFLKSATTIPGAEDWNVSFFNLDSDSDYDLLTLNEYSDVAPVNFYNNNGTGTFTSNAYINSVTPAFKDYNLSYTLCDLNNDNGIDILFTSRYNDVNPRTLYFQKSGTKLYQTTTGIADLMRGSSEAADFNNDGRQDIIICGKGTDNLPHTYIYSNTPSGFVLVSDKLKAVAGHIAVADYDNDHDIDILITGQDRYGNYHASLYRNDNNWKFTEIFTNLYKKVEIYNAKPQFADFNNDGRLDLFCGKVYRNDGNDVFTEIPFEEGYDARNSLRMFDINNDGIIEVLGRFDKGISVHKYNGVDSFLIDQVIIDDYMGNIDIADINGDKKPDIFSNNYPTAFIFRNQIVATNNIPTAPPELTSSIGDSGFYSVTLKWKAGSDDKTPRAGLTYNLRVGTTSGGNQVFSSMTSTSTNNPLLKPGMGNVYNNTSWFLKDLQPGTYYWSVQTVDNSGLASAFATEKQFTILAPLTQSSFLVPGRLYQASAGADFDGDNDMDLIIKDAVLTIYRQTAPYTYTAIPLRANCELLGINDLNNDNLPDIIVKHNKQAGELSDSLEVFINMGNMNFTTLRIDTLSTSSTLAMADFDNDGDVDILAYNQGYHLFENKGNLQFIRTKLPLTDVLFRASLSPIDIDCDGDVDFIISGKESMSFSNAKCLTLVYENKGDMNFSLLQNILPGIGSSSFTIDVGAIATNPADITWNDFNFDGYPDLLITGDDEYANNTNQIFLNDGTGKLNATSLSPRPADRYSSTWIDFNSDGYLDIIIPRIGYTIDNSVYFNKNNTAYEGFGTAIDNIPYPAFIKAIDVDNDKDKDILVTNKIDLTVGFRTETVIYTNNNNFVNQAPNPPTSASHEIDVFDVILNWNKGWDKLTGNNGLTYNIWVGTANNKADIISPMADLTSGYRFVEALGNVGTNTSWRIKNLPLGTYYWSVQTIDNSLTPSAWAPVKSFTLSALTANFKTDTVCFGTVTHFTDVSVTTSPILSWLWDFGDGNISTQQNPSFMFTGAGNKPVKLVVTSAVAKDSVTINVPVKNIPEAQFTSTIVCAGKPTSFTNTTNLNSLTVNEWHWDFGDGSGSNVKDPGTHGYLVPDDYNAILVAVATNGCSDTVTNSVVIGTIPNAAISSASRTSFCSGDSVILTNAIFASYNYTWQLDGVDITGADQNTFTAKERGTYTVTVINPVGNCRDTSSSVIVTVKENPVKPGIDKGGYETGDCIGETPIKLRITDPIPGYKYTWYKNEAPYSNSTSIEGFLDQANYYVRAELDECIVFSDDTAKVYSPDSPPKPVINAKGPTVWYLMSSITNASKYRWYFNGILIPEATNSFYIANQKLGKYNLSISNDGVCYTISDTLTIPHGFTGIEEPDPFEDISIYPNPATGMFTIEMNNNIFGELIIDIFTQKGSKALNIKFEKTTEHFQAQIDLSGQPKGMYLVNLSLDKFKAVRKVVVE